MTKLFTLACALAFALVLDSGAHAAIYDRQGHKIPDVEVNSPDVDWELLSIHSPKSRDFNGVGTVGPSPMQSCTATFLDTGGGGNTPAYILSNGHCMGELPRPDEIVKDRPARDGMVFRMNYFADAGREMIAVDVRRIVYGTMQGTDISIMELAKTFGEIRSLGITPYRIDDGGARTGEHLAMAGTPVTGVRRSLSYTHLVFCDAGATVDLHEGGYAWQGAVRHHCSSVGGNSGSPMISLRTHHIVAINNTGVDDEAMDEPECALNRPCEVSHSGRVETHPEENYAERVDQIPSCFDSNGVFDRSLRGCRLEK